MGYTDEFLCKPLNQIILPRPSQNFQATATTGKNVHYTILANSCQVKKTKHLLHREKIKKKNTSISLKYMKKKIIIIVCNSDFR